MYKIEDIKNTIICGHTLEVLKQMPDESVNTIITSPPYWGLRDYGEDTKTVWDGDKNCEHNWNKLLQGHHPGQVPQTKVQIASGSKDSGQFCSKCGAWYGQLGLEPTLDLYISHLLQIILELKRVLRKDGIMFWNQGDCYGGSWQNYGNRPEESGYSLGQRTKQTKYFKRSDSVKTFPPTAYLQPKCLALQNFRLILKMIDVQGWILRNSIIWNKPNHMPSSVKDRFSNAYEPVFMLVKNKRYWFDLDAVREPHKEDSFARAKRGFSGTDKSCQVGGFKKEFKPHGILDERSLYPAGKNPSDIWEIPLSLKYTGTTGHSNRQGLNRPLDIVTIKAYKEYQQPIALYLKKYIKKEHKAILDKTFGEHKWTHWVRTDFSGAALPGVEDWFKLKGILGFDDIFDDKIYEVQKLNIPVFQSGRNPSDAWEVPLVYEDWYNWLEILSEFLGVEKAIEIFQFYLDNINIPEDFWSIPTQAFPMNWCPKCKREVLKKEIGKDFIHKNCKTKLTSHFATFPEKLVKPMILAGCPQWVCKKCGKVRVRITKSNRPDDYDPSIVDKEYREHCRKSSGHKGTNRPISKIFKDTLGSSIQTIGWTDCGCNAGWDTGIVLDPFIGAGTVGVVATKLGRDYIGIDIKSDYVKMAEKRIKNETLALPFQE